MKIVTPRRLAQQIVHCATEALSAIEHKEDPRHVVADLNQARQLIDEVLKTYGSMARGAARGDPDEG
jgi:hypothetical protein